MILKGFQEPFYLYTVDLDTDNLLKVVGVNAFKQVTAYEKRKNKVLHNKMRQQLKQLIEKKRVKPNRFRDDKDITHMRETYTESFFLEFKRGMNYFVDGKWDLAK